MNSWTWSRTANTKDVSNKILTNQTNLTSTFYTGSIGHDVTTGVEFTRETQTNYGVNPVTLPAVNIYHPDSSIHPGGLTRNAQTPMVRRIPSQLRLRYAANHP